MAETRGTHVRCPLLVCKYNHPDEDDIYGFCTRGEIRVNMARQCVEFTDMEVEDVEALGRRVLKFTGGRDGH